MEEFNISITEMIAEALRDGKTAEEIKLELQKLLNSVDDIKEYLDYND